MTLSDEALSILTFAAYHQLESGDTVSEVVLDDGKGHTASHKGAEELKEAGLLAYEGDRGKLTSEGAKRLATIVEAIRNAGQ